jgi:antitoxin (DNA-binding transcriptional repressor) of toxin-antitoxin stability system
MLIENKKSDNLISMTKTMTATEVSRNFSDALDQVAAGETILITRGKSVIAQLGGVKNLTSGRQFAQILPKIEKPDDNPGINSIWEEVGAERDKEAESWDRY